MKFEVISIGSATLDVFIKAADLQILKTDQVFTGRALIMPYGAKCEVDNLLVQSGGGGTNTAVGFSRLGLRAAVLARCGQDFASQIITQDLQKEKVADSLLIQLVGDKTDYSTILVGPDGDRTILVYRGETKLEEDLINWEKLLTSWFYISSLEGNLSLLKKIISFAQQQKIKVALNPGRKELSQKEALRPILKQVEVAIVNREEAALLTGLSMTDNQLFYATSHLVNGITVVTDGSCGATLCHQGRMLVSDGFKVQAAASTGAGDAFGCGFVAGLIMDWGLEESLKLGICNGASVVTKIGAKTGLLHQPKEVEEWLKKSLKMDWQPIG